MKLFNFLDWGGNEHRCGQVFVNGRELDEGANLIATFCGLGFLRFDRMSTQTAKRRVRIGKRRFMWKEQGYRFGFIRFVPKPLAA